MQKSVFSSCYRFFPGLLLCFTITLIAMGLQVAGQKFSGAFSPDALVLAIIIGVVLRGVSKNWFDIGRFEAGIGFAARFLLELAVMLLGASLSVTILIESGLVIITAVVVLVTVVIAASYGLSRLLRLPPRLAFLIACGNAICGNSAIAAVASVIKARSAEIAPALASTAVLGVGAVLMMPLLIPLLSFNDHQYGTFAGMTVYAVPQVLAATMPISVAASHSGTIVKLIRVLMLGPLIFIISLFIAQKNESNRVRWHKLLPWFIIGFAVLMGLRSLDLIPSALLEPLAQTTKFLTLLSMAALGFGVDVRSLAQSGVRVIMAVTLSLITLAVGAGLFCLFFVN